MIVQYIILIMLEYDVKRNDKVSPAFARYFPKCQQRGLLYRTNQLAAVGTPAEPHETYFTATPLKMMHELQVCYVMTSSLPPYPPQCSGHFKSNTMTTYTKPVPAEGLISL